MKQRQEPPSPGLKSFSKCITKQRNEPELQRGIPGMQPVPGRKSYVDEIMSIVNSF